MTNEVVLTFFAGHESFYLREGWLKKSLDVVASNPCVFQRKNLKEAINILGVGANMVKSMRYWLDLCGLIERCPKNGTYSLTDIAHLICKYDPFFQHNSSLWIIHSIVAERYPLWRFILAEQDSPVFDRVFINARIDSRLKESGKIFAKKTISDSISVFIHTYLTDKNISDPESNIISPFTKLKLITYFEHKFTFRPISFAEYSPYLVYFLFFLPEDVKQIFQGEVFANMKYMMNIELNSLRKSLDYLENENLIQIDRAAGLNNIIKKKQLAPEQVFKKMLKNVSI